MRTRPASSCSGLSTGIAAMVVQFGLAMIRPGTPASAMSPGLTSLHTSGIAGSRRNAELLSMTVTPAAANRGAWAREVVAPAENSATSSPVGSAVEASSTVISPSPQGRVVPAERAEAKNRIEASGKSALGQDLPHRHADLPGGADDAQVQRAAHRPVPP